MSKAKTNSTDMNEHWIYISNNFFKQVWVISSNFFLQNWSCDYMTTWLYLSQLLVVGEFAMKIDLVLEELTGPSVTLRPKYSREQWVKESTLGLII